MEGIKLGVLLVFKSIQVDSKVSLILRSLLSNWGHETGIEKSQCEAWW